MVKGVVAAGLRLGRQFNRIGGPGTFRVDDVGNGIVSAAALVAENIAFGKNGQVEFQFKNALFHTYVLGHVHAGIPGVGLDFGHFRRGQVMHHRPVGLAAPVQGNGCREVAWGRVEIRTRREAIAVNFQGEQIPARVRTGVVPGKSETFISDFPSNDVSGMQVLQGGGP